MKHTMLRMLAVALAFALCGMPAATAAPKQGGTVSGTVTFDGDVPKTKIKKLDEENSAGCKCKEIELAELKIDKDSKGIANVVIEILACGEAWAGKGLKFEIDQKGCVFSPHILIVPPGAEIVLKNSDEILHNVRCSPTMNPAFNEGIPAGKTSTKTFEIAEKVKVACDVHSWMSAWVVVTTCRYNATTGDKGTYEIKDVPPGKYKLRVWHEKLGTLEKEIEITDGGKVEANFQLKKESK